MSFKIASKFVEAANVVNRVPTDKFPLLLNRIIQKLHIRNVRLFTVEEEEQLRSLFSLLESDLKLVLDCCCYIFEQAAFSNTGPESLYEILLEAGFDEPHGKVLGRLWATEGAAYVNNLKTCHTSIGYNSLESSDYQLGMVLGQSSLTRQQEPTACLQLSILNKQQQSSSSSSSSGEATKEVLCMEFNHAELYSFFNDLERIQKQIDCLSNTTS